MKSARLEFYKSKGNWRWRVRAANGKILAVSSEGYRRIIDCDRCAVLVGVALKSPFERR